MKKTLLVLAVFYVVSWKATEVFYKACPQKVAHNVYTQRDEYSQEMLALACFDTVTSTHSWTFKTKEDADKFIDGAPKNNGITQFGDWQIKRVEETDLPENQTIPFIVETEVTK